MKALAYRLFLFIVVFFSGVAIRPCPGRAEPCLVVYEDLTSFLVKPPCDEGVVFPSILAEQLTKDHVSLARCQDACDNEKELLSSEMGAQIEQLEADVDTYRDSADQAVVHWKACEEDLANVEPPPDGGGLWFFVGAGTGVVVTVGVVLVILAASGSL